MYHNNGKTELKIIFLDDCNRSDNTTIFKNLKIFAIFCELR